MDHQLADVFLGPQEKPLFLLDEMVSEISAADASQSRWPLWYLRRQKLSNEERAPGCLPL